MRVAVLKSTLVTLAVHLGLGQASGGATGSAVVTLKSTRPFLTSVMVWLPETLRSLVWPGATLPAGLVQTMVPVPLALRRTVTSSLPRPATEPEALRVVPLSVNAG